MTIYQRMQGIFEAAEVPLFHMAWRATEEYPSIPETYAVYEVREGVALWADNAPQWPRYEIAVVLYSPTDPTELVAEILEGMGGAPDYDERWSLRPVEEDYTQIPGGRHQYRRLIQATFDECWTEPEPEEAVTSGSD